MRTSTVTYTEQQQAPVHQASAGEMQILADALGDSPETVIGQHLLTSATCGAWYTGDVRQPRAVAIQAHGFPGEPIVFGESADAIARLIPRLSGWSSVSVPLVHARELERPIAIAAGTLSITTLEDVHHVLDGTIAAVERRPEVRLLTDDDRDLLEGLPLLTSGEVVQPIVAAAIIEGEIVSVAYTFAWSRRYVDLGVTTHEDWRGQGFATSAAAIIAEEVRASGRVPVGGCGAHN